MSLQSIILSSTSILHWVRFLSLLHRWTLGVIPLNAVELLGISVNGKKQNFVPTLQIIDTKEHNDFYIFCHVSEITIYGALRTVSFQNKQTIKVVGIHSDPLFWMKWLSYFSSWGIKKKVVKYISVHQNTNISPFLSHILKRSCFNIDFYLAFPRTN